MRPPTDALRAALEDLRAKVADPSVAPAPSVAPSFMRSGTATFAGLEAAGDVIAAPLSYAGTAKARRRERRKAKPDDDLQGWPAFWVTRPDAPPVSSEAMRKAMGELWEKLKRESSQ